MSEKPLAIDLYCGLGGWTEGLLAEGYRVVGFDIERHVYGEARYPAQLVIQDVTTLHGSQFKDATLIVASPPCQAYSYRAMPWKRAKALPPPDNTLFEACFRIQAEANAAVKHHCHICGVHMLSHHAWTNQGACGCFFPGTRYVPLVVENVRGAQKYVGRARWHYGSFYLWGDVPALMPIVRKRAKVPGFRFDGSGKSFQTASVEESGVKVGTMGAGWYPPDHPKHVPGLAFNGHAERNQKRRTEPGNGVRFTSRDCGIEGETLRALEGVKFSKTGDAWFDGKPRDKMLGHQGPAAFGSKSNARKHASAQIAKIPLPLARHIAAAWR